MTDLKNIVSNIKLVAFDVDGVITTGEITYVDGEQEIKSFNCKDGQGINLLSLMGIKTAIITARVSKNVEKRVSDLNITEVFQGSKNKIESMQKIMEKYNLDFSQIAYVGDDLPDICVLQKVAFACCPVDAVDEVKKVCNFISSKEGGKGAVREIIDFIIYNSPEKLAKFNEIFNLSLVN
jgi:3-deoxy-D-manno-octulosonate 8-phosphate phosphatase (KDO 8-P phosphatase)